MSWRDIKYPDPEWQPGLVWVWIYTGNKRQTAYTTLIQQYRLNNDGTVEINGETVKWERVKF